MVTASLLTRKQRAFCDLYAGPGTGTASARAAGYKGSAGTVQSVASKLLRDARVRARITERLGAQALERSTQPTAGDPEAPKPMGLVKGLGRGTATERIELLMKVARSRKSSPLDKVRALLAAAELEGERPRGVVRARTPVAVPPPVSVEPASTKPARLALVLSPSDRERSNG